MSEHLTPLDATFLELEEADDSAHMHIGAIMVFDALADGGRPSREQLCTHLASRLRQLPRYRQRLSEVHTGGLSWPEWEDDPAFELARHVLSAALPAPGADRDLQEWASGFYSQRLDRHRPLWEMVIVEGLAGGRWALASKTHHCMVDGVGSVDVGHLLLDPTPVASPSAPGPPLPQGAPGGVDARFALDAHRPKQMAQPSASGSLASLGHAWAGLLPFGTILRAAQMGAHGVLHPRGALHSGRSAMEMIVREELHAAARTSLNEPIGTLRRLQVMRVPLADLKEIKSSLGGTVNDVALAVTASGLRALLVSRGEALPAGLRAMVPVNVRVAGERLALGNRVSSLFIELPVADADPVRRYRETVARSESLKSDRRQADGTTAVLELAGLAPPVIHAAIAQALYATRLFNLTITNVPGPQKTLYAFGAPLREVYPLVPLAAQHAVGVALLSYDGAVFFGVVADRDSVPDLEVFMRAMRASVEELLAVARDARLSRAPRTRRVRPAVAGPR